MSTRLTQVVFDANDTPALARWWGEALELTVGHDDDGEAWIEPPAGGPGIELVFCPVPEAKTVWNRIPLDLAGRTQEHQAGIVARLESLGAERIELDVERPWVVLKDPEGNEFCVLRPRD